jgi:hypothetical protein
MFPRLKTTEYVTEPVIKVVKTKGIFVAPSVILGIAQSAYKYVSEGSDNRRYVGFETVESRILTAQNASGR